ncbi:MAG: amidase [Chloroflexi bacterium]|nr:amidase [Chloroflexota bacterium]
MHLYELTATEAVRAMRTGQTSPVELVRALLDRIAATEPRVQAWETLDAEGALAAARHLEAKRREYQPRDLLFGLPVGLKDIFLVRGLPTTASFDPWRGAIAGEDSGVARHLREAGAIVLGKTVTTQFATAFEGEKTRNPWNLDRSPGGSSSGSAAAVAARQVPAGIGTQTSGSTLRPAAYCGVVALKPTFGRLSRYGLQPGAWTLDHPGIIVRTVADAALVFQALARHDARDPFSLRQEPEDFVAAVAQPLDTSRRPRLGLVRDLLDRAEPDVRAAAQAAAERLRAAGCEVQETRLPVPMSLILAVHRIHRLSEGSAGHLEDHAQYADHFRPSARAIVEVGQLIPAAVYVQASRLRRRLRTPMLDWLSQLDAVVGPTAPTLPPAPSLTGDPSFQSIWSLVGVPNVTLPTTLSPERLPHAIQLVAGPLQERRLLRLAARCEALFDPLPSPL